MVSASVFKNQSFFEIILMLLNITNILSLASKAPLILNIDHEMPLEN